MGKMDQNNKNTLMLKFLKSQTNFKKDKINKI